VRRWRVAYRVFMRRSEDKIPLEDLCVGGKIILKWNLKK
jgi:hypothetical protein